MALSGITDVVRCYLFLIALFCLCSLTSGFSPVQYKNVTRADGSYLGYEAVLEDINFMLPSSVQLNDKYTAQDRPLDSRRLQSNRMIDYPSLPSWLRKFLEHYFPDYFPPKSGVPTPQPTTTPTSTPTGAPGIMSQFQRDLLKHQNMKRNAVGLRSLIWDEDLAAYSRNYMAQQDRFKNCAFEHSKSSARAKVGRHTRVGENLYMSWGFTPTGKGVVEAWYEEINCYKYGTVGDPCTKWNGPKCNMGRIMVGHFTQMMWALTSHMGCDVHNCNSCRSSCPQVYVACTYASVKDGYGGNIWGETPFDINVARALGLGMCSSARSGLDATAEFIDDGAQVEDLYIDRQTLAANKFEGAASEDTQIEEASLDKIEIQ